jgi:transposase
MRGVKPMKLVTAATIVGELGDIETSVASIIRANSWPTTPWFRGSITKTGNAHVRRVIVETAWYYRHQPGISDNLRRRQRAVPTPGCSIAWNACHR